MKKATIISIITMLAILLLSVSSFAANNIASDAVQGVRNVVGGAENVVENVVNGASNGIKNGISKTENATENTVKGAMTTDKNNTNYNATRTATTRTMNTNTTGNFLGMSATTWSWIILGIVGIITVALVWFYGKQYEDHYNHDNENY